MGGLAFLLWVTGLDALLAQAVYHPNLTPHARTFATVLRHYGTLPGALLTILGLGVLLWPGLWQRRPLLYRCAVVITLTAILGVGLANQIIVKKIADRPRPAESILIDTPSTYNDNFRGNSMPSGHAAMGFLLAAPFFPLRRQKPQLAVAFLATGFIAGTVIGLSRMMLGAHFATDVLIAGVITLSAATLFTVLAHRIRRISHMAIGFSILAIALAVMLGNRFAEMQLILPLQGPIRSINLPCPVTATPTAGVTTPMLTVMLKGYGAPLSNLKLREDNGIITLQRHFGLYHHLTCTATLNTPSE